MKRFLSIILQYLALLALYMLISWGVLGIFDTFSIWRVLIMGCVFCAILLAISEYKKKKTNK